MTGVEVGQIYRDTVTGITFRVMRLNEKSARVEPCELEGWHELQGFDAQYRVPFAEFYRGRHFLLVSRPS